MRNSRRLLAFIGFLTLLFGLAMLHPYPRQALFGPTIRGVPWCVWEEEIRRHANRQQYENSLWFWFRDKMGVEPEPMADAELYDHAEMLPLLLLLAADKHRDVRGEILQAIRNYPCLRDPSCVPMLRSRIAEDDYQENRLKAAFLLWEMVKDKVALPVIARDIKNRDCIDMGGGSMIGIFDGGDAMHRLGQICVEAPEMMPTLCEFARHPDFNHCSSYALHVGTQLGVKGIPVLVACLDNKEPHVRIRAVMALGGHRSAAVSAIPALERRRFDSDKDIRDCTRHALQLIDPVRFQSLSDEP